MAVMMIAIVVMVLYFLDFVRMSWSFLLSMNVRDSAVAQWTIDSDEDIETAQVFESFRTDPQMDLGCFPAEKAGFHMLVNGTDDLWLCCNGEMHGSVDCHEVSAPALY